MKGVKYSHIVALLNFIYQGEVNVAQDDLSSFLAVAEELKVKGLTKQVSLTESQQQINTKTNCVQKNIFQKQKDQDQSNSAQLPFLKRARKSNEERYGNEIFQERILIVKGLHRGSFSLINNTQLKKNWLI